jgi:hypothetical protein
MSRDAVCRLEALPADKKKAVLKAYEDFRDPLAVFRPLQDPKRVKRLKGEIISNFIVLETDAVTFFPSVYSSAPAILDFAVAMNRCIFCKGLVSDHSSQLGLYTAKQRPHVVLCP